MKKMLIVEDHPFVAQSTKLLFLAMDVDHVETCRSADEAVTQLRSGTDWFRIWLDLNVPGAHGLSLVRHVFNLGLANRSAVITGSENHKWQSEVQSMGFLAYLFKTAVLEEFSHGLAESMKGQLYFNRSQGPMKGSHLTALQIEILGLLHDGCCTKDIARTLGLSLGTVDNHISNIIHALEANDRTHAVALGMQYGYIQLHY
jgi:two-component system response regulator DesR